MPCQLPADCLNEIFEYLEEDKVTLHSCLLVSRLWCDVAVRILWRNIWNFNTLIACLPNESRDLLHKNGILIISTPISKLPLFNYPSFCKALSIRKLYRMVKAFLENQRSIISINLDENKDLLTQEILNMFMKKISSLKKLTYYLEYRYDIIPNNNFSEAKDRLTDLSILRCHSKIHSEFFYQLSQICHNIQSLTIRFQGIKHDQNDLIFSGLKDLISSQNGLKYLSLTSPQIRRPYYSAELAEITPSLTKHSNTITTLRLQGAKCYVPSSFYSFISKLTNLRKLIFSFRDFNIFDELQYFPFPQLQVLNFCYECPGVEMSLINFLEINGKNLKELYLNKYDFNSLNLSIAKFCPNLRSLATIFMNNEIETLKVIFHSCKQLESINIWCGRLCLEKEILEIVANHSPDNFHRLKLCNISLKLFSKDLESFFVSWKGRVPQKPLSFIVTYNSQNLVNRLVFYHENMKIIEKYGKLGIIKKFGIEKK